MVMKHSAVCLVALIVFSSFCEGQWRHFYRPAPQAYPSPRAPPTQSNPQAPTDIQQSTQISKPLTWQYPGPPQPETIPVGPSVSKIPVAAASVAVTCNETSAHVEVMEDLFGNGLLINPADLTLGNCGASAEDNVTHVLIFDVELQACGSTLSMTNESIVYSFILHYNPHTVANIPVVRSSSATVLVQCHYPRMQDVSSHPVNPYWSPFSAVRVAQEFLYFSMNLMNDNWEYLSATNQYYMGDMIRIQVSVMQYFHVPLRVYVDSCIATTSPDTNSSPSYVFIDQGCMLDGLLTGSTSQFLPRTADNKLQFELEAFQFQGASSGILYITCHLIATMSSDPVDSDYRACSYINGWKEASGANSACSTCYSGGSSPPGSGAGSSAAGPGAASSPGVGSGPTGYFNVGVGASGSVNTVSGPTGSLSAAVPVASSPGVGLGSLSNNLGPTGYMTAGGAAPGPSYVPVPNVPTTAGGAASGPGYVLVPNVPTAAGGAAPGPSYVPVPNVPTATGGAASGPGYVLVPNVPTAAGGAAPGPSYVPVPNVLTAAGGAAPGPSYVPVPNVLTAAGGAAPGPSYVPVPNVPTATGGAASGPSYVPVPNVPTAAGGAAPGPSYVPVPNVPTATGGAASGPSYVPVPNVPTAAGGAAPGPSYVAGPSVSTVAGGAASGPSYVPVPNVPTATGGAASGPSYVPVPNVPTAAGGAASGPSYVPVPNVPTAAGGAASGPSYVPVPNVPTAAGGAAPGPSYRPGPYVSTAGGGGALGLNYGPGPGVSTGFEIYGPLNTGPIAYLDFDESPGAGFPVAPGAGLGATPSGSGFGVTGSFGNFGTVPHFPPFIKGRKARDVSHNQDFEWEAQICMGPIRIQERPV